MRRAWLFALLILGACSSAAQGLLECPATSVLVDGVCRARCSGPAECLTDETCSDGACVPRGSGGKDAGEPAEDASTTTMCINDIDCGRPSEGEWGPCGQFEGACDETGIEERGLVTRRCKDGKCDVRVESEQRECVVSREGEECEQPLLGDWTECRFRDACESSAMRFRVTRRFSCSTGMCVMKDDVENEVCDRPVPQDGTPCGFDQQCCAGSCTPMGDHANCGVCGLACALGRACVQLPSPMMQSVYACECEGNRDECRGYGPSSMCVGGVGNTGVCSCGCPDGMSPCQAECASGSCYVTQVIGVCSYP